MPSYGAVWRARMVLLRPGNAMMAALAVVTGLVIAAPSALPWATWIAAPLAAFLVTGFGNVLNDVADLETDRRAHPERPLPSGQISRADATGFAALLLGLGVWEAFVAGGGLLAGFAGLNAALLVLYEWKLKARGLAGNVVVAVLVGSAFVFGATAATGRLPAWGVVWLLAALATATNLAREVLKDLQDVEADRAHRRTFPMIAGRGGTLALAAALVAGAVATSAAAVALTPTWWQWWVAPLVVADATMLTGAAWAWRDPARGQFLLKLGMLAAVIAFLSGALLGSGSPLAPQMG